MALQNILDEASDYKLIDAVSYVRPAVLDLGLSPEQIAYVLLSRNFYISALYAGVVDYRASFTALSNSDMHRLTQHIHEMGVNIEEQTIRTILLKESEYAKSIKAVPDNYVVFDLDEKELEGQKEHVVPQELLGQATPFSRMDEIFHSTKETHEKTAIEDDATQHAALKYIIAGVLIALIDFFYIIPGLTDFIARRL